MTLPGGARGFARRRRVWAAIACVVAGGGLAACQSASTTYVVTSTADTGGGSLCQPSSPCTLRAAIERANRDGAASRIEFDIGSTGTQTISVGSGAPLESLFEGFPTTIDGYTQPGSSPNSDPEVSNAVLRIQIDGDGISAGQDADGISMLSSGNVVRGLALFDMHKPINIVGTSATGNVVAGNFLGTNAAATFGANAYDSSAGGVIMEVGASRNRIGGPAAADRNVISGNGSRGVFVNESNTDSNVVENNIIGLAPRGDRHIPNISHGIDVNSGGNNNVFVRNVLSGNGGSGVEISHPHGDTRANQVVDNVIGLRPGGREAAWYTRNSPGDPEKPNVRIEDGVVATEVRGNVIGNSVVGGIRIDSCVASVCSHQPATTGTQVVDNLIGVTRSGRPTSNGPYGVEIDNRATLSTIGPNNEIAYNDVGVRVVGETTDTNTITRNRIHDNAGLGIDLAPPGRNANDPNDADTGPNQQLNFPDLQAVEPQRVRGTACAGCTVEVFATDASGEGRQFLASGTANSSGSFDIATPNESGGRTATATDGARNTSEFFSPK